MLITDSSSEYPETIIGSSETNNFHTDFSFLRSVVNCLRRAGVWPGYNARECGDCIRHFS